MEKINNDLDAFSMYSLVPIWRDQSDCSLQFFEVCRSVLSYRMNNYPAQVPADHADDTYLSETILYTVYIFKKDAAQVCRYSAIKHARGRNRAIKPFQVF